jgi:hypothetical protein
VADGQPRVGVRARLLGAGEVEESPYVEWVWVRSLRRRCSVGRRVAPVWAHAEDRRRRARRKRRKDTYLLLQKALRERQLPGAATIRSSYLDDYVEAQHVAPTGARGRARARLLLASELLSVVGQERFLHGLESRQRALEDPRAELLALRSQSALAKELTGGDLLKACPTLTTREKRRLPHGLLDRVVLTRANGRGKNRVPVGRRTEIVLRGNAPRAGPICARARMEIAQINPRSEHGDLIGQFPGKPSCVPVAARAPDYGD